MQVDVRSGIHEWCYNHLAKHNHARGTTRARAKHAPAFDMQTFDNELIYLQQPAASQQVEALQPGLNSAAQRA
jgi:hypothetical protein